MRLSALSYACRRAIDHYSMEPITSVIRLLMIPLLSLALFEPSGAAQDKMTPDEAKKSAKEAYIFSYPLVMMYRTITNH